MARDREVHTAFELSANLTEGDYARKTYQGGFIIHGRSDTTLNPGGVRIGTAELYRLFQDDQQNGRSRRLALRDQSRGDRHHRYGRELRGRDRSQLVHQAAAR